MKVATFNGCKVYDLSSGKKMPEWLTDKKKRELSKDADYRRRLELIQDFEMPIAAQCIKMTKDREHIIVTGMYPPIVRCYTVTDMSLKFQRGLTSEVVAMECLSDNFGKLVFLQADRTLNFHAPYGTHYSVRVPYFGRDLLYDWNTCDLYVASCKDEVFRFNLESGCFKESLKLNFNGCNKLELNPMHPLLACGGENSTIQFYDSRNKKHISTLVVSIPNTNILTSEITSMKFDQDGITLAAGTSTGHVVLYDIRSRHPMYTKEHQYGTSIIDLAYHHNPINSSESYILSTDKKVMKIWNRKDSNMGQILTNIEPPSNINSVCTVSDVDGRKSGLVFLAGEQSRVMSYFIPQLGPAPKWCSFLEGLTEELEESNSSHTSTNTVYADYKFVTQSELEELGAVNLVGTNMLKGYMHGYFMDMTLYSKLRAVSKPFEYEEHRKQKILEKMNAKKEQRITKVKRLPKVNKLLAEKIMKTQGSDSTSTSVVPGGGVGTGGGKAGAQAGVASLLTDDRFKSVFQREEFEQDIESHDYKLRNPSTGMHKKAGYDSDEDNMLYNRVSIQSDSNGRDQSRDEDDEWGGSGSDDDSGSDGGDMSDDEEEGDLEEVKYREGDSDFSWQKKNFGTKSNLKARAKSSSEDYHTSNSTSTNSKGKGDKYGANRKQKKPVGMFELNAGVKQSNIFFGHTDQSKREHSIQKERAKVMLGDRMNVQASSMSSSDNTNKGGGKEGKKYSGSKRHIEDGNVKIFKSRDEGMVREMSYVPSGRSGAGLGREEREMRDDSHFQKRQPKKHRSYK
jgi:ribosome biogenesis protein ENP2